jgi:hypothetical protein
MLITLTLLSFRTTVVVDLAFGYEDEWERTMVKVIDLLTRFTFNSSAILSSTLLWITTSLTLLLWMSWIYCPITILTIGFQPLNTNRTTPIPTLISRLFIQCYLRLRHVVHGISKISILFPSKMICL